MQGRKITIFFVLMFLISILPIVEIGQNSAETITSTVKWSGVKEIDNDVIIKSGAILTIADDTIVNINSDISFSVEGSLIIEGVGDSGVQFIANISQQSELGLKSNWEGIILENSGVAEINGLSLNGTRNGIKANLGSNLEINNSTISDSIQGVLNYGTAELKDFNCINVQNNCITNAGSMNADMIFSNHTGQLLSHNNTGTFTELSANNTGVVVEVSGGATGVLNTLNTVNTGLVLRAYGDQSGMTYSEIESEYSSQLFDVSNSEALSLNNIQGVSINSVLLANYVDSLEINSMYIYDSNSVGLAMEISTSDSVKISNATINGYGQSFLFSGGGSFSLINTTFFSNGKIGELSSSTLEIEEGDFEGKSHGLHTQYSTLTVKNVNITVGENHGTALQILGGSLLVMEELNLTHEAQWSDSTSIGLHTIWSDVTAETVNIVGFSTGVSCETTSTLSISNLSIIDNVNLGYSQACSESIIDELITTSGRHGLYSKTGEISIGSWTASYHTTSLMLSDSSAKTYIRNWEGTGFTFAAQGEASELFYGTSTINENLIQINGAEKYFETDIEITDLSGQNPLEGIVVSVHKFNEITNIEGIVTLPLTSQNSDVHALDSEDSISRLKSLSTNILNPRIELPVLPSDGSNWVVESGVNIVLNGFNGELLSNITIQDGGSLDLIDTSLTALNVSVEVGGILTGVNSNLIGNNFSISSSEIGNEASSLLLEGIIEINCELVSMNWYGITLKGDVNLITNNNCELSLFGGGLIGFTTISQGGSIVQFSNLVVNVVDQGAPIPSALITLDGVQENNEVISAITDVTGTANLRALSMRYNENGAFDLPADRIVTMEINSLEISQTNYWDVSQNSEMTFIASTVNTDEVFNFLNLDLKWSPYYLFDDLVVSGLMQIEDGVDLQISTNKGIIVSGQMNIGSASLHGTDWSGILVNGGGINFDGSYLLNAVQSLTLENYASGNILGSTFSNSIQGHILLNSGSTVDVGDSTFELGDDCIKTSDDSEIMLDISSSNISLCEVGIRATGAQINLHDIQIYTAGTGIRLIDVSGNLKNISIDGDFEIYNGPGNPPIRVISDMKGIEIIDQINELSISNIIIDMQDIGFSIEDSIGIDINLIDVSKIMFVRTSGHITNLISNEVQIENTRSSEPLEFVQINTNLVTAVGNSGQSCISLNSGDADIISLNDTCIDIFKLEIGEIILNSSFFTESFIESSNISSFSVDGEAELFLLHTHNFIATLEETVVEANFALTQENSSQDISFVGSQSKVIIWKKITSKEILDLSNATLVTTFNGALPYSAMINLHPTSEIPIIQLEINPPPIVSLILPDGLNSFPQGLAVTPSGAVLEINYTAYDQHEISSITWNLLNLDTNEEIITTSESAYRLSSLIEGEYSLSIIVIDFYGASTIITQQFTISAPDNDGDNIASCVSELWWDDLNQRHCGSDNVDKDDDNDGYVDTIDDFPFDSCAFKDTDSDGYADKLIDGCITNLILDLDVDGNGVLDANEIEVQGENNDGNSNLIVWLLLLLVIGGALFRRFKLSEV